MTETERLRAMLDERGVEWSNVTSDGGSNLYTEWRFDGIEGHANATEWAVGGALIVCVAHPMTPEQAIEATLGRGECYVKTAKKIGDLFGFSLSCGHSMVNPFDDRPDYCPWCGRKVRA